jgi:hypothetical protein
MATINGWRPFLATASTWSWFVTGLRAHLK